MEEYIEAFEQNAENNFEQTSIAFEMAEQLQTEYSNELMEQNLVLNISPTPSPLHTEQLSVEAMVVPDLETYIKNLPTGHYTAALGEPAMSKATNSNPNTSNCWYSKLPYTNEASIPKSLITNSQCLDFYNGGGNGFFSTGLFGFYFGGHTQKITIHVLFKYIWAYHMAWEINPNGQNGGFNKSIASLKYSVYEVANGSVIKTIKSGTLEEKVLINQGILGSPASGVIQHKTGVVRRAEPFVVEPNKHYLFEITNLAYTWPADGRGFTQSSYLHLPYY